jgi:rare lipoprotein A
MRNSSLHSQFRSLLTLCAAGLLVGSAISRCLADDTLAQPPQLAHASEPTLKNTQATRNADKTKHHIPDFSANKRMGKASFYANEFAGRKMADGALMDPHGDNAASKTLPLGTTAKVTNLETGKSAVVTIQDRGPYVPGRIVDLSPSTAREIGISPRQGVALVVVAPIAVPQPGGGLKLGAAAHEALETITVAKALRDTSTDSRTVLR